MSDAYFEHELHVAASKGDGLRVDSLLGRRPHLLEAANEWGWTPLMQAAAGGHLDVAATLISVGADVNATNKLGMNVLSVACSSGNQRLVRLLLENGAKNSLATICAVVHSYPDLLRSTLTCSKDASQVLHISGSSCLHLAVAMQLPEMVHTLINKGVDPNLRDEAGRSALDLAEKTIGSAEGAEMAKMLRSISECKLSLEWSEEVMESSQVGDLGRLMHLLAEMGARCAQGKSHSHVQVLSKALLAAAESGNALVIDALLRYKPNLNVYGDKGMTPLMLAAANGHLKVVERLLSAGADSHLKSSVSGHKAFELASLSEGSPPELTRLLAKHTIRNAEAVSPKVSGRQWPLSPQPVHRLLQIPKSPHKASSLPGSPTYQRSFSEIESRSSSPSKRIKHLLSCVSNKKY